MSEVLVGAVYVLITVSVAIAILMLADRLRSLIEKIRNPPHVVAERLRAYEQRLRSPNWSFYEQHLQRPVPEAVRTLFSADKLKTPAFNFDNTYVTLSPIDEEALRESWVVDGIVPFADSEGDPIYLKPGASEPNSVFITYHDGGDTEQLALSIEAFAGGLRNAT